MPSYDRGNESVENYLVRILAAIVRSSGGELRVKGHMIDEVNDATVLIKEWDKDKNELVLRAGMHSFTETFKVVPVRPPVRETVNHAQTVDPLDKLIPSVPRPENATRSTSTVDNPNLVELERKRNVAKAAALIRDELKRRKNASLFEQ